MAKDVRRDSVRRKTARRIAALCLAAMALCIFAGCGGKPAEIVGIKISSPPYKTEYCVGDTFDASGMEVCAIFDDGTAVPVADYAVDKSVLQLSDSYVTVSYRMFSVRQHISVTASGANIFEDGTYTVEAEELVSSSWKIQPGREQFGFIEGDTHPQFNPASGGKCVGSLGIGTEIVFNFRTGASYDISFVVRMASVSEDYSLSSGVEFYIAGEYIRPPEGYTFGYGSEYDENQKYTDWRNILLVEQRFESGSYEFRMKIVEQGCNVDAFFLYASSAA